jgi:hypothetical protein
MTLTVRSLLLIAIFYSGCGGGGGGETPLVPNYAGAWSGRVDLVNNTCPRLIPDEFLSISFLHNVNQGVTRDALGNILLDVVLDDGRDTFVGIGQVDARGKGSSFSVSGSTNVLPGFIDNFICREIIDYQYDAIEFPPDTDDASFSFTIAGFVNRHSSITCTRGNEIVTCDVTYTGQANRVAESV